MSTTVTTARPLAGTYVADPAHSSFSFAVRYLGVQTFRGSFADVEATLVADGDRAELTGKASAESISIRTPQPFRDHVLSAEFFGVAEHPHVTFRSTHVELAEDGRARVDGELTVRGIALPVHAEGSWSPEAELFGSRKAGLTLEAVVDRTAFGIVWNADSPTGGKALANDVTLTVELVLLSQQPAEG
jgi:polyisoprenoid-binding protein YceI